MKREPMATFVASSQMNRLEKLVRLHEAGELPRIDWLDSLTFRQIEKIHLENLKTSSDHYLYIDLPKFDFPIICSENYYPSNMFRTSGHEPFHIAGYSQDEELRPLIKVYDTDISRDNPVEAKNRRLVRSQRNGPLDRDLKPNAKIP